MDKNVEKFVHVTLVTSSTADLTPDFSESIFTPTISSIRSVEIALTLACSEKHQDFR